MKIEDIEKVGKMRVCWICKTNLLLNIENYYKNKNKPDGWGTECRPCHKKASQNRRSSKRRNFIAQKNNQCESCGISHDNHMFFDIDHIEPLHSVKVPRGLRDYNKDKVQILCPNCHRNKTIKDLGWGKYDER